LIKLADVKVLNLQALRLIFISEELSFHFFNPPVSIGIAKVRIFFKLPNLFSKIFSLTSDPQLLPLRTQSHLIGSAKLKFLF